MTEDENELAIIKQQSDLSQMLAKRYDSIVDGVENERQGADAILRALSGDESCRFRALRFAANRLGSHATRLLIPSAAENGMSKLRLVARPRAPNEFSDGGARERRFAQTFRTERIGRAVYGLMKDGMAKADAIRCARKNLRLNLSDRSMERELTAFRKMVRERGYIGDQMTPSFGTTIGRLRLRDLPPRGRPKNRPMVETRTSDLPAFELSQKRTKLLPIEAG